MLLADATLVRLALPLAGLLLLPGPAPAQQVPPPMFSPWYAESLRDVLDLEPAEAATLERTLAANPEDRTARLRLMAYYQRADRAGRPEDRAKRVKLALWLVAHHPDSEVLHSPVSRFTPAEMAGADTQRAIALWDAAAKAKPGDAAVLWNAACFFEGLDPGLYLHYLEATAAADPNHPYALRPLANLYALSLLEGGPAAAQARAGLEASKNVWVLGNAAYMLQSQYNRSVQLGTPNRRAAELAERYFVRAQALAPNLDREAILPRLGPAQAVHEEPAKPAAVAGFRRLPVDAFGELPPAVASVLRGRGCTVPQPAATGSPVNAIRGEFFGRGETGWAVLCSVTNLTALLAFRNGSDTHPETIVTSDNQIYLGGDDTGYPRQITAVGREFIMRHYRAYGGPEPPPIDHQGIDDAFLGKASVTWYFYQGKWLRLTGAD